MIRLWVYSPNHAECGWPAGHYAASRKALEKNGFPLLRPGINCGAAQPPEGYVATQPSGAPAACLRYCLKCSSLKCPYMPMMFVGVALMLAHIASKAKALHVRG